MPAGLLHHFPKFVQDCLKLPVDKFTLKLRKALHPLSPSKSNLFGEIGGTP